MPSLLLKYRVRKQSLSIYRHPEQEEERRAVLSQKVEEQPAKTHKAGHMTKTRKIDGLYAYKLGFAAWLAGERKTTISYLLQSFFRAVRPSRCLVLLITLLLPRSLYLSICGYKGVYR